MRGPLAVHILGMLVSFVLGVLTWAYLPPLVIILLPVACFHFGFLFCLIMVRKDGSLLR